MMILMMMILPTIAIVGLVVAVESKVRCLMLLLLALYYYRLLLLVVLVVLFLFFFYQRVSVECRCRWDVGLTFFSAYETLYYEKTTQDQVQSNVYAVNKFQMPMYYLLCGKSYYYVIGGNSHTVQLIYG